MSNQFNSIQFARLEFSYQAINGNHARSVCRLFDQAFGNLTKAASGCNDVSNCFVATTLSCISIPHQRGGSKSNVAKYVHLIEHELVVTL